MQKVNFVSAHRPIGLTIAALAMILFGLAEVATGFSHNFFGLTTAKNDLSTLAGVALGLLYILSGALILPLRKWGALLAIFCLGVDVAGRVAMVAGGLYPIDTAKQSVGIIVGTLIAAGFAVYIGLRWKAFR